MLKAKKSVNDKGIERVKVMKLVKEGKCGQQRSTRPKRSISM